jgi:hypothetical protein
LLDGSSYRCVESGCVERGDLSVLLSSLRNREGRYEEQNQAEKGNESFRPYPPARDPIKYLHCVLYFVEKSGFRPRYSDRLTSRCWSSALGNL